MYGIKKVRYMKKRLGVCEWGLSIIMLSQAAMRCMYSIKKIMGMMEKKVQGGGSRVEKENDDGIHYWSNEFKYIRGCLSF